MIITASSVFERADMISNMFENFLFYTYPNLLYKRFMVINYFKLHLYPSLHAFQYLSVYTSECLLLMLLLLRKNAIKICKIQMISIFVISFMKL